MAEDRDAAVEVVEVGRLRFRELRHRFVIPGFVLARLAALALALQGCTAPLSTLDPAGPVAARIATLWWVMLAGACVILLGVCLLALLPFVLRERRIALSTRTYLLGGGVGFSLVTLAALMSYAFAVQTLQLSVREEAGPVRVHAIARQWAWEFVYPEAPGGPRRFSGRLHIPAGRPILVRLSSEDVIHSFWIPRLAGKRDAIPGQLNELVFVADTPGRYAAVCAEFCGLGHARMTFTVEVHPPADFDALLAQRAAAAGEERAR